MREEDSIISIFVFTLREIILSISISLFIANCTPALHRRRMNEVIPMILGSGYTFGTIVVGHGLSYMECNQYGLYLG